MSSTTTKAKAKGPTKRYPRGSVGRSLHSWQDEMLVRVLEYGLVWVMALVVLPLVGEVAHLAWGGGGWRWLILALTFGGAAGLSFVTYHEAAPRGTFRRWRAAVTVGLTLISLGVTTIVGFVAHEGEHWRWVQPWVNLYTFTAFLMCVAWNIPRTEAVRGTGDDDHPQDEGPGKLAEVLGISKPVRKVGETKTSDDGVRHEISLQHIGTTQGELAKNIDKLPASIPGLPPTAVRAVGNPGDATRTKVTLVTEDVLRESAFWPGPSRPGVSVAEPCRIGVYEDGHPLEIVRPGDPKTGRNAISTLVMGTPGAGKTEGELVELAELATRPDVVVWWCDTAKGAQTGEDIAPAIDWLVTSKPDAQAMARALRRIINYRSGALAMLKRKYKAEGRQWTPDAWRHLRMPYLVAVFEEFADVADAFGSDIVRIGEQVRSVGISLSISLQRATGDNINTSLRSSLGGGWAFGIKDASDALLVLSELTLSMGANPGAWSYYRPGMNYLEASHVDQERWAMPARTFRLRAEILQWHLAYWCQLMASFDKGSVDAMGPEERKVYDKRSRPDLGAWIEAHDIDLAHPPKGTPEGAIEAIERVALPMIRARTDAGLEVDPPAGPIVRDDEPEGVEPPVYEPITSAVPQTEEETEDMLRADDRVEAQRDARALDDPETVAAVDAADGRRPAPQVAAEDDLPLGGDLPEMMMTANEALVDVFRALFRLAGDPEWITVTTSDLAEMLAARGFYSSSNPRPFLGARLTMLADEMALAERIEQGRGPKASVWRISRGVLTPPPPNTDGE